MIESSRRGFISGLVSLIAAPAIVRPTSIMPVKSFPSDFPSIDQIPTLMSNEVAFYPDYRIVRYYFPQWPEKYVDIKVIDRIFLGGPKDATVFRF